MKLSVRITINSARDRVHTLRSLNTSRELAHLGSKSCAVGGFKPLSSSSSTQGKKRRHTSTRSNELGSVFVANTVIDETAFFNLSTLTQQSVKSCK